ncbi:MAG: tRNA (adenosine(37)-N6)-dimethylallyltransferase MiaA [Betaproteobacteria bacterium]
MRAPPILLMGPTASGKSALAMGLAGRWPIEIISVDSAQVYRDMDVGTAKPTGAERERVAHHLIDIVAPTESYSAARFAADANALIGAIEARGAVPVLAGGTMLYFRALTDGLSTLPRADPAIRAELDARAARDGWARLHAELAAVDAETAARLQPLDKQRVQRALEVYRISGQPLSVLLREPRQAASARRFTRIALVPADRAVLHQRIASRFDAMLEAGLVDELRRLRQQYSLHPDLPSMRAVGYRQAWQFLDGEFDFATLRARGVFATRQLAKRQLTWLRATPARTFDALSQTLEADVVDWLTRELAAPGSAGP